MHIHLATPAFFFYPVTVSFIKARLISLILFTLAVLTLIFGDEDTETAGSPGSWWWVPAFLAVDAFARVLGSSTPTTAVADLTLELIKNVASFVAPNKKPGLLSFSWYLKRDHLVVSGLASQFSTLIQFDLSTIATLIYWIPDSEDDDRRIIAKVVLGLFCAVEFFHLLGLPLGNVLEAFVLDKGLIRIRHRGPPVPQDEANASASVSPTTGGGAGAGAGAAAGEAKADAPDAEAGGDVSLTELAEAQKEPGRYIGTDHFHFRTPEDPNKTKMHAVKHFKPAVFAAPVGIAALSLAWQMTNINPNVQKLDTPDEVWQVLAWLAAAWFVVQLLFLVAQAALFSQKTVKYWQHPILGPMFGLAPICASLLCILARNELGPQAYTTLVWIAATFQLAFSFRYFAKVTLSYQADYFVSPVILIPALGLFVSSIALVFRAPTDTTDVIANPAAMQEAAGLFYYTGYFMWVVLTPIVIYRYMTVTPLIPALSHATFLHIAASGVAALASGLMNEPILYKIAFFFMVWQIGLHVYLMFNGHFWRRPFDHGSFFYLFPIAVASAAISQYSVFRAAPGVYDPVRSSLVLSDSLFGYLSWVSVAVASLVALWLIVRYGIALVRHQAYLTEEKWGPVSLMKITHIALRCATKKMDGMIAKLEAADKAGARLKIASALRKHFLTIKLVHEEHAKAEDHAGFFGSIEAIFPGQLAKVGSSSDHKRDHVFLAELETKFAALVGGLASAPDSDDTKAALSGVVQDLKAFKKDLMKHLNGEEASLQTVGRKTWNLRLMLRIHKAIIEITPLEKWRVILPFIIRSIPAAKLKPRMRLCYVLRWGSPDLIQCFGKMIYEALPAAEFAPLAAAVPEMVPRTVYGHVKMY